MFELTKYGPWPLKKDGELRKRMGRGFWQMYDYWWNEDDREQFIVDAPA